MHFPVFNLTYSFSDLWLNFATERQMPNLPSRPPSRDICQARARLDGFADATGEGDLSKYHWQFEHVIGNPWLDACAGGRRISGWLDHWAASGHDGEVMFVAIPPLNSS